MIDQKTRTQAQYIGSVPGNASNLQKGTMVSVSPHGIIGEIVDIYGTGHDTYYHIKVLTEDGVTFHDISLMAADIDILIQKVEKSNLWKKFISWLRSFRKK